MRSTGTYACKRCGLRAPPDTLCNARCTHALDRNGNAPPPSRAVEQEWFGGTPDQLGPILLREVYLLGAHLKRSKRRRRLRRLEASAGPARPIAGAPEGLVVIEGRVDVVEPVVSPEGEGVAAYITRNVRFSRQAGHKTSVRVEHVSLLRESGRFFVKDDTGAALIDDDWVLLLDAEGNELDVTREGTLAIYDGQPVRVIGHAREGGFSVPSAASSFRSNNRGLEMVGGTGRPVCVRMLP